MTEHFMKEQNFKNGVRAYLKKHQYGNAVAEDLWQSLTEFADLPGNSTIRQVMDTWTNQPGYPVVNFNGTTLTQERFFLNASGRTYLFKLLPITPPPPQCSVCGNGFYVDISSQHQVQQCKLCLRSLL